MAPPTVHSPIDQRFTCNSCGKCCHTPWKVKVAAERVPVIESTARYQTLARRGFTPLPVVGDETQVGRDAQGACLFHVTGGCSIHAEIGKSAKPIVCQIYPFSLVNSPEGYFLSLHFSCPSVLKGTGQPLVEQLPALAEAVSGSTYFSQQSMPPDTHVALTWDRALSWRGYRALEQDLLTHLGSVHPVRELLEAATWLAIQSRDLENFQWHPQSLDPGLLEQVATEFLFYTAYTAATLDHPDEVDQRAAKAKELLEADSVYSLLLDQEVTTFTVLKPDQDTQPLVERYLQNYILGKQLLSGAPMVARLLMLAVALSLLFYYLENRPSEEHETLDRLAWGFHLMETRILGHSDELTGMFLTFERELVALVSEHLSTSNG